MILIALAAVIFLATCAKAHGGVNRYTIDGVFYPGYTPTEPQLLRPTIQRKWNSNFPQTNLTSPTLTCNTPGTPAPRSAPVYPGSSITVEYDGWPHDTGAVIFWLASCPYGCWNTTCSDLKWFKIQQTGLMRGSITDGWWALRQLQSQNGVWNVTIPEGLKAGEYLFRSELVALHVPFTPEFYPECANLRVLGNGTRIPGGEYLAEIPGVYQGNDSNLVMDIWADGKWDATSWPIPGPEVWTG